MLQSQALAIRWSEDTSHEELDQAHCQALHDPLPNHGWRVTAYPWNNEQLTSAGNDKQEELIFWKRNPVGGGNGASNHDQKHDKFDLKKCISL